MRTTEQDSKYSSLDKMSTLEVLRAINTEDASVPGAIAAVLPKIEALIDGIVSRVRAGGRVFYLGAGTSGRLGIVDASEIPPTYGVSGLFIGLMAGGDGAIRTAVEGAEDDWDGGWADMLAYSPRPEDAIVGIAASGTTPYVIGAVKKGRELGLLTGCITCNEGSPLALASEFPIEVVVGPEVVTGSTRMKSGTAQKLVLNMISTTVMIKLGHVKGSRMVDMNPSNKKLVDRGARMIMDETGIQDYGEALALLRKYGQVRAAVAAWQARGREV